jgi:biotin carboxylase
MAHLLFVDANEAAFGVMHRAVELGHRVTFIGADLRQYREDRTVQTVREHLARSLDVEATSDASALVEALRQVEQVDPIDAVFALEESAVEATAVACRDLNLPFTNADGVQNARNKERARKLLAEAGLPSARFAKVARVADAVRAADEIGYPVVVKPASGLDSIMAHRANDAEQVRTFAQEIAESPREAPVQFREQFSRGILVEEYLAGELVSAELGVLDRRTYRFMVSGRAMASVNECIEMGVTMPANVTSAEAESCYQYAESVCKVLGLDLGIFCIELMLTNDGPILVEANPRLMGSAMPEIYRLATGEHIGDSLFNIHLRTPIERRLPKPKGCVTVRRLLPREDAVLSQEIDLGWVDEVKSHLVRFLNYSLFPGAPVKQMEVTGRVFIRGENWADATLKAEQVLDRVERSLGVELVRPL